MYSRHSFPPRTYIRGARLQPPTGTQDLIVVGLDDYTTNDDLRTTFQGLVLAQVKRHMESGRCKGYAFIRFNRLEDELKCLSQTTFYIRGRVCNVRRPDSHASGETPVVRLLRPSATTLSAEARLSQPSKEVLLLYFYHFSLFYSDHMTI